MPRKRLIKKKTTPQRGERLESGDWTLGWIEFLPDETMGFYERQNAVDVWWRVGTSYQGNPQPLFLGVITHSFRAEKNLHFSWFWGLKVGTSSQYNVLTIPTGQDELFVNRIAKGVCNSERFYHRSATLH